MSRYLLRWSKSFTRYEKARWGCTAELEPTIHYTDGKKWGCLGLPQLFCLHSAWGIVISDGVSIYGGPFFQT